MATTTRDDVRSEIARMALRRVLEGLDEDGTLDEDTQDEVDRLLELAGDEAALDDLAREDAPRAYSLSTLDTDHPTADESADDVLGSLAGRMRSLSRDARRAVLAVLAVPPLETAPARVWAALQALGEPLHDLLAEAILTASTTAMASLGERLALEEEEGDRLFPPAPAPPPDLSVDGRPLRLPLVEEALRSLRQRRLIGASDEAPLLAGAVEAARTLAHQERRATVDRLKSLVADAVAEGTTLRELRRKVEEEADGTLVAPQHVETLFRTNVLKAYADGQERLLADPAVGGLFPYRLYHATHDSRVRPEHLAMERNGIGGTNVYRADDPVWQRHAPPWAWNCLLPGNEVQGVFVGASKSLYAGKAVELATASGLTLRVTANHPVLTPEGFKPANSIREGDYVVCHMGGVDRDADDEHDRPALVEDVFCAIADLSGGIAFRPSVFDFHGDEVFVEGDVEVVLIQRELGFCGITQEADGRQDRRLVGAATDESLVPCDGASACGSFAVGLPSPGDVSSEDLCGPPTGVHAGPFEALRFGLAANLDASVFKPLLQHVPADAQRATEREQGFASQVASSNLFRGDRQGGEFTAFTEGAHLLQRAEGDARPFEDSVQAEFAGADFAAEVLHRFPGVVACDEVVEVREFQFAGHVYDLQSAGGWIVANGVFNSNCRCVGTPISIREAARRGVAEAQRWLESGIPPSRPAWVRDPGYPVDTEFERALSTLGFELARAFDASAWEPYTPKKGKWAGQTVRRSKATGRIVYSPWPKDGGAPAPALAAKSRKAKPLAQRATPEAVAAAIAEHKMKGLTSESISDIVESLMTLTVPDLQKLKKALGERGGGTKKADLQAFIREKAGLVASQPKAEEAGPAPKPPRNLPAKGEESPATEATPAIHPWQMTADEYHDHANESAARRYGIDRAEVDAAYKPGTRASAHKEAVLKAAAAGERIPDHLLDADEGLRQRVLHDYPDAHKDYMPPSVRKDMEATRAAAAGREKAAARSRATEDKLARDAARSRDLRRPPDKATAEPADEPVAPPPNVNKVADAFAALDTKGDDMVPLADLAKATGMSVDDLRTNARAMGYTFMGSEGRHGEVKHQGYLQRLQGEGPSAPAAPAANPVHERLRAALKAKGHDLDRLAEQSIQAGHTSEQFAARIARGATGEAAADFYRSLQGQQGGTKPESPAPASKIDWHAEEISRLRELATSPTSTREELEEGLAKLDLSSMGGADLAALLKKLGGPIYGRPKNKAAAIDEIRRKVLEIKAMQLLGAG